MYTQTDARAGGFRSYRSTRYCKGNKTKTAEQVRGENDRQKEAESDNRLGDSP